MPRAVSRIPETGCISLLKAMAMGSIPITSRFASSALPELTSEWDMGPHDALASYLRGVRRWAKACVHSYPFARNPSGDDIEKENSNKFFTNTTKSHFWKQPLPGDDVKAIFPLGFIVVSVGINSLKFTWVLWSLLSTGRTRHGLAGKLGQGGCVRF